MKNILKTFLAVICSIGLFFALGFMIVLFQVENNLSKKTMIKNTKEIDVVEFLQENDITSLDKVYEEASNLNISKDQVNAFLNTDTVRNSIGEITSYITEGVILGKEIESFSLEDWHNILYNGLNELEEKQGIELTTEQKERFLTKVKDKTDPIIEELPKTIHTTKLITEERLETIRYVFSQKTKLIGIGVIILLTVLIILLKRKEKSWLLYIGTPIIILSILLLLSGGLLVPIASNLLNNETSTTTIIQFAFNNMRKSLLISGVVLLIIAIICFIIYGINPKKQKEVTNMANL